MSKHEYTFGPLDRSGVILGMRLGQVCVLAGGATLALLILLASHGATLPAGVAVLLILAAIALAFLPISGRGLDEWIPVVIRWFLEPRSWRSPASRRGTLVMTSGATPDLQPAWPSFLAGVKILSVALKSGDCIGIAHDRARGTYTSVIRAGGSAYVLLSDDEKAGMLAAWGSALSSLAHRESPVSSIQFIARNVAEYPDGLARFVDEAAVLGPDDPIADSYRSLIDSATPVTQSQQVYIALTISSRRAGKAIASAGGFDRGAAKVMIRLLSQLEAQLANAQIQSDGVLTPRLLAQTYRESWEPFARHGGRTSSGAEQGVAPTNAAPQSTTTTWRHFQTDGGALHATYWISEWPRISVGPNFLVPLLLQTNARLTCSVTMAPVDPARAERDIEAAQTAHISDEMVRSNHGFRTSARTYREADAIERREREFADGHAEYRFSGYLTVTARDEETLASSCDEVTQQARNSRLDLRRMDGEHDLAFTYTLPLGRGLQ